MGTSYDVIAVGGGLGGSALALAMAKQGARVLVLEREEAFRDRVRGEGMMPWGVAEARALGIEDILRVGSSRELPYWDQYFGPGKNRRELVPTTRCAAPILAFYHPEMQEALLAAARAAGAEVRRHATVRKVTPGKTPRVAFDDASGGGEHAARLVVGADGRASAVRRWAGLEVSEDPARLLIAGVLLEGAGAPPDAVSLVQSFGRLAILFPQGGGKIRAYLAWNVALGAEKLSGAGAFAKMAETSCDIGVPRAWYSAAKPVGPLATFDGADSWVPHPHKDGVALVGDAAASSDPSWGQGLSLTLRDVRVLRDKLLGDDRWDVAADAYAAEHDRYYGTLHTMEDWFTTLFMDVGDAADARRGKALPQIMADPKRVPDVLHSGPDVVLDEAARARFFGE